MKVAVKSEEILNPAPRQCKLLGATVRDVGVVTAVEANLHSNSYALLEGDDGVRRRVLIADLKRDDVTFPAELQPYVTRTERVDYGVYDEVHALCPVPVAPVVVLAVAA